MALAYRPTPSFCRYSYRFSCGSGYWVFCCYRYRFSYGHGYRVFCRYRYRFTGRPCPSTMGTWFLASLVWFFHSYGSFPTPPTNSSSFPFTTSGSFPSTNPGSFPSRALVLSHSIFPIPDPWFFTHPRSLGQHPSPRWILALIPLRFFALPLLYPPLLPRPLHQNPALGSASYGSFYGPATAVWITPRYGRVIAWLVVLKAAGAVVDDVPASNDHLAAVMVNCSCLPRPARPAATDGRALPPSRGIERRKEEELP